MKNKIMIVALLCALLVGLVPPSSVKASVDGYPGIPSDLNYEYFIGLTASSGFSFLYASRQPFYYSYDYVRNDDEIYKMRVEDGEWVYIEMIGGETGYKLTGSVPAFSNHHIVNKEDDSVFFSANYVEPYTFEEWCSDAGLNCSSSSDESSSVIPFWYEPNSYNYIVGKNLTASSTSGVYNLLMIQKGDGGHYPYCFNVNDIEYLGIGGSYSTVNTFTVRKFYYDADGGGWRLVQRHDVSELPFDLVDFAFDENTVFIYSDVDIYADRSASSVWQYASTEYYNVDIPEQPEEPSVTPTVPPSGGSGDTNDRDPNGPNSSANNDVTVPKFDIDWNDVKLDDIPDVIRQIKDAVLGFFDIVGVVPLMIGAVFGFLPSWCLWMFGLSFALLGVLLVIKLIRG